MGEASWTFDAGLWLAKAESPWVFLTVPAEISDEIEAMTEDNRRGFGSVRVQVTLGESKWTTSDFPDTKQQAYVLPVKKAIRASEGVDVGDRVHLTLALEDG